MNRAVSTTATLCNLFLAGFILLAATVGSRGAVIVMNGSDAINTTSFNTGLHWTGGGVPVGVNVYQTSLFLLRSPTNVTPVTFAGNLLDIQSGGEFRLKTIATITVNNLIMENTAILDLTAPIGGNTGTLAGNITLNGISTFRSGILATENVDTLTISSGISGTGGFNTTNSFGTIILAGTNSYTAGTTVNGGTLLVNGKLAGSSVTISSNGIFGGNGIVTSPLTNQSGGTLQPGQGGTDVGTLTISNNLVLAGTTMMVLNRTNAPSSSRLAGISTLTQGGTLIVTNIGAPLQANDSFTLFSASTYAGSFSTTNLPTLSTRLLWSNMLSLNGTIVVFALPPTNPVVTDLPATQVHATAATLNGLVLSTGGENPLVTIYYGTNDAGTNAASWQNSLSLGAQNNNFNALAAGLATNTTYYFTAFASNSAGISWASPSQTFTTLAVNPVVTRQQVLTYHYGNARRGANTNETLLTLANVNTNTFGKLFSYTVDGYVYTEPLIMTNVAIPGQGVHDVVFIATEHDTVYAFDANSNTGTNGGLLWKTNLGVSALSSSGAFGYRYTLAGYPDIVPEVGATGTPVIDPVTGTIYLNALTHELNGSYVHRIHALDITTGAERSYSPVVVAGSVHGTGVDSSGGVMTFSAVQENQRPALTLAGGKLYVGYAGYADTDPYHGWLFGYNATNLVLLTNYVFNTTPNASVGAFGVNAAEGGFWMGGSGACVDDNTNLYLMTGNGSFSQNTNGGDYADSFLKLSTTNGISVADYFTPFDQAALQAADMDLGSCGPVLLPDSVGSVAHPHLLVSSGKVGTIYLLDRDNLGKYQVGSDSQIVQSVIGGLASIWSSPAYFNKQLFFQASSSALRSFAITNGVLSSSAISFASTSFGTYNGGPVVSANGNHDAIVWAINSAAFATSGDGILYAYNATNLSQTLYNSSQLSTRDSAGGAVKLTTPTVAGGKVYVGTEFTLSVYGVQLFLDPPILSPNGGPFTNAINISISDASPGTSIYYTLDGTTPTEGSTLYTGTFVLTTNALVRAIASEPGAIDSAVTSASFVNTAALGNGIGLIGQYYNNHTSADPFSGSPILIQTNATINFNWTTNGPDPVVGATNLTVLWTGSVQAQYTEPYTFYTTADDGVRLFINGQLFIDDWVDKTNATIRSNTIALASQQFYSIELDYYQNSNNASVALAWSSPSVPFAIVPQTQLYPSTNPPPTVFLTAPANGASYTASASVTVTAEADAPFNPINAVNFYANNAFLGSVSNAPYTMTPTGLAAGAYAFTAVAIDGSGLSSTSAPVNLTVTTNIGLPYGLTNTASVPPFLNMPTTFNGSLPPLLSQTGVFSNTPAMQPQSGLVPYTPNTPLWSDGALKTRYLALPNNGGIMTPDEQITFVTNGYWTFPAGSVFVKTFELNTDTSNPAVRHRLETRLLVRDINGQVYGVTYKWRADNSDADLLGSSLFENIAITNLSGVTTQTWYYPSPSDCLQCHTPVTHYVLGLNTRQLNGNFTYPSNGVTDNQLRVFNRLGLFNPAFNESAITNFEKLSALTNTSVSLEERARSYLDANCAQCHQPGGSGITFDARYDTSPLNQHITNFPASHDLGFDNARIIASRDVWRSMIYHRMNTNDSSRMPPLARSIIDTNAVQVLGDWINSLPGLDALAPPAITPNGGTFFAPAGVTLQVLDTNAAIYYSLDGSLPTTNSALYSGTLNLTTNVNVSAAAFEAGFINSVATRALFFVQPLHFTSGNFLTNSQFQLQFTSLPGSNYVLQASSNLFDWTPISTNPAVSNLLYLIDPGATNFPQRFYRIQQQ